MKKWLSRTIDGVLGAFIVFLVGCQVTMMVTKKSNYDVPSLFGSSFLQVLTDSMVGTRSDSLNKGTGIIISKVDLDTLKDETTYPGAGDVITFYDTSLGMTITHRIIDKEQKADDSWVFYCFGDNAYATDSHCDKTSLGYCSYPQDRNVVEGKYVIGKVVAHSDSFGGFLGVIQSSWFIPTAVLVPLAIIAALSVVDVIKEYKKENALEEAEMNAAMLKAGVDPKDEAAVLLFEEKERYREDLKKEMAAAKEKEKKRLMKEMKKKGTSNDDKIGGKDA